MPRKQLLNAADYIEPLYMNGLQGRMLRLKANPNKNKEIMVVYGLHSSLERMFSMAEALNKYGSVTIPDLPGLGGMQSYYRLKEKPTIDNLADYLASFVKLRYKNRRVVIIGVSSGFVIVTRMLQRYPELTKKVDLLINLFGFVHHEDKIWTPSEKLFWQSTSKLFSHRLTASWARHLLLRPALIRSVYSKSSPKNFYTSNSKSKRKSKLKEDHIAYEIHLWKTNDLRTQMYLTKQLLKLDLCQKQVNLPVYNVKFHDDIQLNSHNVEQHLGVIYSRVHSYKTSVLTYSSAWMTDEANEYLFPAAIKKKLAKA